MGLSLSRTMSSRTNIYTEMPTEIHTPLHTHIEVSPRPWLRPWLWNWGFRFVLSCCNPCVASKLASFSTGLPPSPGKKYSPNKWTNDLVFFFFFFFFERGKGYRLGGPRHSRGSFISRLHCSSGAVNSIWERKGQHCITAACLAHSQQAWTRHLC